MANVYPFSAWLPAARDAEVISSLPYDVMSRQEARKMAEGNPFSFLRVTCADLEFGDEVSSYDDAVYLRARDNWQKLTEYERLLTRDAAPSYYVYSQVMDGRRQSGIVACASVADYKAGVVRRHELTRQAKEDDRTRHILTTAAQTGPVFLAYRDSDTLVEIMNETMASQAPLFDFNAEDGIRHAGWRIPASQNDAVASAFDAIPILYIADGHHRAASAARVYDMLHGSGESDRFLAVIFPQSQLRILAYNRVLHGLNGMDSTQFLERLRSVGTLVDNAPATPQRAGEVSLYIGGRWHGLAFARRHPEDPIADLDVSLLQEQVLAPMLGIDDPRTSKLIDFVGGIRGTAELERLVDGGECVAAFSMHPTSLEQLMRVADANGIMPPKSTWFEPKLRDGLFTHSLN